MKSVDDAHARPDGTSDATVEAVGKLSEAFEVIEEARGSLYAFHRNLGRADLTLGEAVDKLRAAGHTDLADEIETDLLGRNVLAGRWTFQVVEEFDDGYYSAFRDHDRRVREALMDGRRHVFEAEMKEERRTHGRAGHEATPDEPAGS
ncbi:hypothetical protein LL946_04450 [Knoellia locipacati]|uniref:hypothetical protein n=1 Tax=Knoellia locipacati TaxID=882824 RepID=UPI00384C8583